MESDMTRSRRCVSGLLIACFFSLVACQDVQPASTQGVSLAQTDMDDGAATDRRDEMSLDLRLEALDERRPDVLLQARNPFVFGSRSPTEPVEERVPAQRRPPGPDSLGASREAFVPPVRLRMIGLVESVDGSAQIAVLTDGEIVLHGREGDIMEGRYRIIDIASTSVEIESIEDGRRRVLRLTGS